MAESLMVEQGKAHRQGYSFELVLQLLGPEPGEL
jgi:hypothetical protein